MLVGRERELATIDRLLGNVAERGGALLIRGEPGIGKSALLEEAELRAVATGMSVLRTVGVASESHMAFAGLHQLLLPHIEGIACLPRLQAEALGSAFGLVETASAPDAFLVALAALEMLADAAEDAPLLIVVEDAHWLDGDSAGVLTFVARRLELEPIAMTISVRESYRGLWDDAGLEEVRLEPLSEHESVLVLDSHGPALAAELRRRVLDTARGNPLALLELPLAIGPSSPLALADFTPLPITDALRRAFLDRFAALPQPTRWTLLLMALDHPTAPDALVAAMLSATELAPAEEVGLVEVRQGGVRFRHPLIAAAISQAASTAERRAAHAALAHVHRRDPDRAVWHDASAAAGPDDAIAQALEQLGARARRRGAPAMAAAALERAAELREDSAASASLLLEAAEMEFELGRSDLALALLGRIEQSHLDRNQSVRVRLLLEAADEHSWSGPERVREFAEFVAGMVDTAEPERAVLGLLVAARGCWWANPPQETRDLVVRTAERLPLPTDSPALLAVLGCADPVRRGAILNERIAQLGSVEMDDPRALHLIGTAATTVWAFDRSVPFLAKAVDGLRVRGELGVLAQALVSQAWAAFHVADGSLAMAAAEEAGRIARETGQRVWALSADLVRAAVVGEHGDQTAAEEIVALAEAGLVGARAYPLLSQVEFVLGRTAVAHQRYEEGYDHLQRIFDRGHIAYHPFVASWALADLVEAAQGIDRRSEAHERLVELAELADSTQGPLLKAQLAYSRPLLADDAEAGGLFEAAIADEVRRWPCYQVRLQLAYGRWLRRQRHVSESRGALRAARDLGDALGLAGLADSARQELRAAGEASEQPVADAWAELTAQEFQIAQLVAQGLTNREIGQRLYLSHRTIGSHLYRIFPKLGVSSRAQIMQAMSHEISRMS